MKTFAVLAIATLIHGLAVAGDFDGLAKQPSPWKLAVLADGRINTDVGEVTLGDIERALLARNHQDLEVRLSSSPDAPYRFVQAILEALQQWGVTRVELEDTQAAPPQPSSPAVVPRAIRLRIERDPQGGFRFALGEEWTSGQTQPLLDLLSKMPVPSTACRVSVDLANADIPYDVVTRVMRELTDRGWQDIQVAGGTVARRKSIYIADGVPRWEWRYLKNELEHEPTVHLEEHLDSADRDFPQASPLEGRSLDAYDLILLGDVEVSKELASSLCAWVESGGGLVLIAGSERMPQTLRGTALEKALPCVLPEKAAWETAEHPLKLEFTEEGRSVFDGPDTPMAPGKGVWWNGDGATAYLPLALAPGARPLATIGGHPDHIAFAVRNVGRGQVFVSAIDETWRWRCTNPAPYVSFWRTAVRLVARVRTARPVCLVQGPHASRFLEEALQVSAQCPSGVGIHLSVSKELPALPPPGGIVILDGIVPPASYRKFVEEGGTLVVVPGDDLVKDPQSLSAFIDAHPTGWRDPSQVRHILPPLSVTKDALPPELAKMLASVRVFQAVRWDRPANGVILDLEGALLLDHRLGKGRVVVFGMRLDAEASSLPALPAFPILVEELLGRDAK